MNHDAKTRLLALLMIMCLILTNSLTSAYAKSNTSDDLNSDISPKTTTSNWNEKTKESIFVGKGFKVTFKLQTNLLAGFYATIKLENTGDNKIENWALGMEYTGKLSYLTNAELESYENGVYVIKNALWNRDIPAGKSVEIGFRGLGKFQGFPTNYTLLGQKSKVDDGNYTVHYLPICDLNSWTNGLLDVWNLSCDPISAWTLEFDYDRDINNIVNAKIESHEGSHYVIKYVGLNRNIPAWHCLKIYFDACGGSAGAIPRNFQLYTNVLEPIKDEEEIDESVDSDNDELPDYLENYFQTRPDKDDTDEDGLSDYIELIVIRTDATLQDTDGNGVKDGDEDADGDWLTNLYEVQIGTDLASEDTDSDSLSDYQEIYLYGTDPLEYDTDHDGVSDGKEIELGTDPHNYDEAFEISASSEEEDPVSASVELSISGSQVDSLAIDKVEDELFFPETMPGYIGSAYEFSVDGEFNEAVISFKFDESLLSDPTFDPVIYYFDEENQELIELDTSVSGNIASATVTHFSKYIILNKYIFERAFEWEEVWDTGAYEAVELVLVIDDSGSMTTYDPNYERINVAKNLVEGLPEGSKVGVVKFADNVIKLTPYVTDDLSKINTYLSRSYFFSSGGTYMYEAIDGAFSVFNSSDDKVLKMMVVLSDGVAFDTNMHSNTIVKARNAGVKIYTVGLGTSSSSYFIQYLKPLAEDTGAAFYYASNASELKKIYKDISKKIDVETDSDGDGIADYFEDNMHLFNGTKIRLDKNNPDTDGDGLVDGAEITSLKYKYNKDKTKVIISGKIKTNPLEPDSDFDGKRDNVDRIPLSNHFTGIMKTEFSTCNISFDMNYQSFFADNKVFHEDIAVISSLLSSVIYSKNSLYIEDYLGLDTTEGESIEKVLNYIGMNNPKAVSLAQKFNDYHLSEVGLGYIPISSNGIKKTVVAVIVRGTNSTLEEWSSNFEIGNLANFSEENDWKTEDNHMGFDIAANRIIKEISSYVSENELDENKCVYWITGHSRGAAIANIIGAYYEKDHKMAYTYTFAAPNTTLNFDAGSYNTIFNIINSDDFVPCLPMESWGYTRYGKTASMSIAKKYEKQWELTTGIFDYNPDTIGMEKNVNQLGNIISSGSDPRIEVYKYTCDCHGDNSDDRITITNYGTSRESREKAIAKIPPNALPYCTITRYEGKGISGWNFDNCQTPAYLMQLLAAIMGAKINGYRFTVELDIAPKYEKAKAALARSYISGIKQPHYTESYYILAKNADAGGFK